MSQQEQAQSQSVDPVGEVVEKLVVVAFVIVVACVCAPLMIPVLAARITGTVLATKTWFWITWRWQWIVNTIGVAIVAGLVVAEAAWIAHWVTTGQSSVFFAAADWKSQVLHLWPWLVVNFLAGILLLPITWSIRRRQVATLVRNRRIADVVQQTRIETARKRAADHTAARRMGVNVDPQTGQITGSSKGAMTAPLRTPEGAQAFGLVNRATVRTLADRFYDARRVRDWIDSSATYAQLPMRSSAVRFLLIAESGTGKTVFLNSVMQCALTYGWPVFFIDAKGDPEDAEALAELAGTFGRTAAINAGWDMFTGTSEQVTTKLMRLMPPPDGANQHYLDEIRGILQAVQDESPLRSIDDLRERLTRPEKYTRDQYDQNMVNAIVDSKAGISAGQRTLQSLLVALRPLERWLDAEGWSYDNPHADITIVPLSPADDTQARLGDLLLLDLRNYLTNRLMRRDKSPVLVVVDEFPQLVTGTSDPGDTAGSLYETARSAGVALGLAAQSPAGLSNDDTRRRRALASGAALIIGRTKDSDDVVKYAGTYMQMESSGTATGEELKSARAQHTYVIHPQEVREANDAQFWIIQGGSMASFRALPNRSVDTAKKADATGASS